MGRIDAFAFQGLDGFHKGQLDGYGFLRIWKQFVLVLFVFQRVLDR